MAYTTINKGSSYFNTLLYTGDGNSTQAVTGVGFSPDWVWIKNRTDGHWHNISDVVRGTGATKVLRSNSNAAQGGTSGHLNSFDSDGFTVAQGSSDAEEVNTNNDNYVAWNWLADSASASNSSGTLTSTVVANTTAGFSICKYTGATGAQTFGHGLGAVPKVVIVKNLDSTGSGAEHWRVYHHRRGAGKYLKLNQTTVETSDTEHLVILHSSTLVYVGGDDGTSKNGEDRIDYCL